MKPDIKKIKAILFDMDGVIINSMKYHAISWVNIFKRYGIIMAQQEIYRKEGIKPSELIRETFKKNDIPLNEEKLNKIHDEKIKYYWDNFSPKPFEGIGNLLGKLKKKYKLAIVSGSPKVNVEKKLNKFDLKNYFDVIIHSDLVSQGKPHPMSFEKAYQELNLKPDECICIENAPYGIRSSKKAGIYTIAITSTLEKQTLLDAGADLTVDTYSEIEEILGV
jgi:beta-phosphoglucomutase